MTPAEMRAAMYAEERAVMKAAAIAGRLAWEASCANPLPRIVGTHKVPAHIRHETIGRFDAPFRTPSQNT